MSASRRNGALLVSLRLGNGPFHHESGWPPVRLGSGRGRDDVDERIGNQVTPFNLVTPDGETLFSWHVMPLPLYLQNEALMAGQSSGLANDFTETEAFRLLKDDPEARLVLYCESILSVLIYALGRLTK